jgi:hypothetical protein
VPCCELAASVRWARLIAGWTEDAKVHWMAEGGELVNDGHGAYLTTDKEFGDIELQIESRSS